VHLGFDRNCRIILATPRIWSNEQRDEILHIAHLTKITKAAGILVGNLGTVDLIINNGLDMFADFSLNIFNDFACAFLAKQGFSQLTLSPELNFNQISQFKSWYKISLEFIVHGNFPVMVSEHCVPGAVMGGGCTGSGPAGFCSEGRYGLKDRMNYIFPIETDQHCRMHLFNSKDICLVEHLPEILNLGIDWIRIEAGMQNAVYVNGVTGLYREALDRAWEGVKEEKYFSQIKERLLMFAPAGFTKGHFFRGAI
jgi:putative protease